MKFLSIMFNRSACCVSNVRAMVLNLNELQQKLETSMRSKIAGAKCLFSNLLKCILSGNSLMKQNITKAFYNSK